MSARRPRGSGRPRAGAELDARYGQVSALLDAAAAEEVLVARRGGEGQGAAVRRGLHVLRAVRLAEAEAAALGLDSEEA